MIGFGALACIGLPTLLQDGGCTPLRVHPSLARYVCTGAQVQAQVDMLWVQYYRGRGDFSGKRGIAPADVPPLETDQLLRDLFIHGTPEACIAQIQALESRTGIHQLSCVFNANGLWSNATALAGMELFAQEVQPEVR